MHPTTMEMNPDTTQALNVDFWGTEVAKIGSQWVIVTSGNRHYPSHNATYTRGAIWIGTATNPDGPYTWAPDATAQDSEAQLYDPSIFVDPNNGRTFLLYAHWTGSPDVTIVTQELDPSNITQLKSGTSPVTLLSTAVDPQARELANGKTGLKIVEGPGVFFTDGQYFLYYGAGAVAYDYQAIDGQPYTFNLATATTFPVSVSSSSRFLKYAAPVLSGGNGWRQPGHGAVFQDGDGTYWTAVSPYHDSGTQDRIVVLQKMTYRHDTKTFSIYNGVINAGAIGVPVP